MVLLLFNGFVILHTFFAYKFLNYYKTHKMLIPKTEPCATTGMFSEHFSAGFIV